MLWLALHLPRLAVEVCAPRAPAVIAVQGRVRVPDLAAEAAGVCPGMRVGSALGLAPGLTVCDPDPDREAAALATLACWAGTFTPQVSLAPPQELLLEIGGCLRLFGGLPALLSQVEAGAASLGHAFRLGLAPTPMAAQWLARAGVAPNPGPPTPPLAAQVSPLPVGVLGLPERQHTQLAVLGLQTLGQVLALPGAGLARRFGPGLPEQLARALGQVPDPRPPFSFPQAFSQRLELPAKVERAEHLLFAARRLLLALGGWLAAHASGIRACRLVLIHDDTPASELPLAFATPTRDPDRLVRVLRERLERLNLAAPVTELRLDADTPEPLPGRSGGLFGDSTAEAIAPVMERLRARLGQEAVHGLAAVADHRPECATRPTRLPGESPLVPVGPRPLGLLPAPEALEERRGQPWRHGRLRLLTRSERIESGWWDGGEGPGDQRRDYFVALSEAGEWLWIFQDRHGWWLHGYFA